MIGQNIMDMSCCHDCILWSVTNEGIDSVITDCSDDDAQDTDQHYTLVKIFDTDHNIITIHH